MPEADHNPENPFDDLPNDAEHPVRDQLEELRSDLRDLRERLSFEEYLALQNGGRLRHLVLAEISQRIRMRRLAAILGVSVIAFMGYIMMHISHWTQPPVWWPFRHPPSTHLAVAMFLAPTVSITAITISFLFGAFRRFKDDDLQIDKAGLAGEVVKSQLGG